MPVALDESKFQGATVKLDLETGESERRFYHNPTTEYGPRFTYWPGTNTLKVEFSVPKMIGLSPEMNVTVQHIEQAFDRVDAAIKALAGDLPSVRSWSCQRVDYTVNVRLPGLVPVYLARLANLRVSTWVRQPYSGGVIWKTKGTRGRWVKFYAKTPDVLRFEVSNYRDAVRYMSKRWFVCERTVSELVRPGRALYVLAHYWTMLGLAAPWGAAERETIRLREVFGVRSLGAARHALECYRLHGAESYKSLALMSKASYYRWLKLLRDNGFLMSVSNRKQMGRVDLPCEPVFDVLRAQNLNSSQPGPIVCEKEKNSWENFASVLGVNPKSPKNNYLMEHFYGPQTASANA